MRLPGGLMELWLPLVLLRNAAMNIINGPTLKREVIAGKIMHILQGVQAMVAIIILL